MTTHKTTLAAGQRACRVEGQADATTQAASSSDREGRWRSTMDTLGVDARVWEIVASIVERQEVIFRMVSGDRTRIERDLFGIGQRTYRRRGKRTWVDNLYDVNGVLLTRAGWNQARPQVQAGLDRLNVAFADNHTGLVSNQGRFAMESIYTDSGACEYRMFDSAHGHSGVASYCLTLWPGEEWSRIKGLPMTRRLVNIDGWEVCRRCQIPIRPDHLRSVDATRRAA